MEGGSSSDAWEEDEDVEGEGEEQEGVRI